MQLNDMNDDNKYTDDDVTYSKGQDEAKKKMCQFSIDGNDFWPCTQTTSFLPCGYYKIRRDYSKGIFLRKSEIILNKLVTLETCDIHKIIMNDIINFWNSKEKYEKRGRIYRKNILLYSIPGMGKTSLINIIIKDLIDNRNGFVISLSEKNDILNFTEAMTYIRNTMPNRPIIAIIEDIDNFIGVNGDSDEIESELLNILDGIETFDNIVIIATTNYPENLSERYINRPSRFNRIIEYPSLSAETRKEFLTKINLKEDIDKINLDEWVKRTDGYTTDFLKELSDSVFISNMDENEAFELIDNMKEEKTIRTENNKKTIGFNS